MHIAGFPKEGPYREGSSFLFWWGCLGSLFLVHATFATSVQSLQHLLKHPHYADDGHQHAGQVVSQMRSQSQQETQQDNISTLAVFPTSSRSREMNRGSSSLSPHDDTRSSSSRSSQSPVSATRETPATQRVVSATTPIPRDFYRFVTGTVDPSRKHRKKFGPDRMPKSADKELDDVREANAHFLKMRDVGRCKEPKQVVIRVKDYYPDPTKEYIPRCTLLHRCSDETGCCDAEGFQCMAKAMQGVALSFYVMETTLPVHTGLHNAVEKLVFVNHTECECLPKNETLTVPEKPKAQRDDHRHHHHHHSTREQRNPPTHQEHSRCRECPHPFRKREYPDGRCSCDCFDRQKPCIRIKRGREPLLEIERRCVETTKCHVPDCEYGRFESSLGRCPKRPDDLPRRGGNSNRNNHNNNPNNHGWNYFERD